ncbi:MAG TPA: putrescine ABC transporter permease PotI, partial [Methylosinus sp.]
MSATLRRAALALGFVFLYGPIVVLVAMSFNASRLVTVWGGFSTRWYAALLADERMLQAAGISLAAAALSALIATINGSLAALALARFRAFRGR